MGCCTSRNKMEIDPMLGKECNYYLETKLHLQFKDPDNFDEGTNDSVTKSKSDFNKNNYANPDCSPIPIFFDDVNNSMDSKKKENGFGITIKLVSFDFMCKNFYSKFWCDFYPELMVTFEEKCEKFHPDKGGEIEAEEDTLNKSIQFESFRGNLPDPKKKLVFSNNNLSVRNNNSTNVSFSNNNNLPPNKNNVRRYCFEKDNNKFKVPEIIIDKKFLDKNIFLHFSLYQKSRRDENVCFPLGEASFPVQFLFANFQLMQKSDEFLEVPIINLIDDIFIGNLLLEVNTSYPDSLQQKLNEVNTEQNIKSLNNFLKMQFLNIDEYGKKFKDVFLSKKEIDLFELNLSKIKIYDIIDKYTKNNEQEEAIRMLYEFLNDDLISSVNTSFNIETDNLYNSPNINSNNISLSVRKSPKLDFKTLSQLRYFIFLTILNEILVKSDIDPNVNEKLTLLKNSKFLNEKIIFSAYENTKNENKNFILVDLVFNLLLNIRKNIISPLDYRFNLNYLLPFFGPFYKKSAQHALTYIEKDKFIEDNYEGRPFGPVSNETYIIFKNIMYKFLKMIKTCLDVKNENLDLKDMPQKKMEDLEKSSKLDIEILRENFNLYFLALFETVITKHKEPFQREILFHRDINYVIGVLNILISYIKLARNLAKNHFKISTTEFYLEYLLQNNSDLINWIVNTFPLFHLNTKYFNLLLELIYELFTDAYGIFIFNFFKRVDVRFLCKTFSVDAKYLDSRKFNNWFLYLSIITKITKLIKKDDFEYFDYIKIDWSVLFKHIYGLYLIINRNHYFKIIDEVDLEFNDTNHCIIVKSTKNKFLSNKLAIKIQLKFFEIFTDFTYKKEFLNQLILNDEESFMKIFTRVVYLCLLKFEGGLMDIVKQNMIYFFNTFLNILNFLDNLKKIQTLDLKSLSQKAFSQIYPNSFSNYNFSYSKLLDNILYKIKILKPDKFDINKILSILYKIK